jgi:hypothetical protein
MKQLEFDFAKVMNIHREAEGLVDVCVGPMEVIEGKQEVENYLRKNPNYLVAVFEKRGEGYRGTIYIDENTFNGKNRNTYTN